MTSLDAVAEDRRDGVREALTATFGGCDQTLTPVRGGASGAAIFRTEVGGRAYRVRLDRPADRLRDPDRHYACMQAAADVGGARVKQQSLSLRKTVSFYGATLGARALT